MASGLLRFMVVLQFVLIGGIGVVDCYCEDKLYSNCSICGEGQFYGPNGGECTCNLCSSFCDPPDYDDFCFCCRPNRVAGSLSTTTVAEFTVNTTFPTSASEGHENEQFVFGKALLIVGAVAVFITIVVVIIVCVRKRLRRSKTKISEAGFTALSENLLIEPEAVSASASGQGGPSHSDALVINNHYSNCQIGDNFTNCNNPQIATCDGGERVGPLDDNTVVHKPVQKGEMSDSGTAAAKANGHPCEGVTISAVDGPSMGTWKLQNNISILQSGKRSSVNYPVSPCVNSEIQTRPSSEAEDAASVCYLS